VLAGDICEARTLYTQFHGTKVLPYIPGTYSAYDFFYHECAKYKKVFYVMGNHEHYHGKFHKTKQLLLSLMPSNVTILEKECFDYEGIMFLGGTLWTDMNKNDPITIFTMKDFMYDYKIVQNFYESKNLYYKLTPDYTIAEHRKTLEYFKTMLAIKRHMPVVVITHMAPSFASVNERYRYETTTNGGYASELSEFILDNDNIKVWIHGHMHDSVDYMIGNTRILSNPKGYHLGENSQGFDPALSFTIP
jgi:Icc-related predicted phosphoesterase